MRDIIKKIEEIKKSLLSWNTKTWGTNNLSINQKTQELIEKTYAKYTKWFEKHISPRIELPEDDEICAQAANQSYIENNLRSKEIESFTLNEKLSTNDVAVYIDTTRQICVLGFRGTIITEFKDLSSDAQILLDIQWIDPRVKNSLHVYDNCKRQYEHFSFRVSGHSLWGTLSYIVAKHRNPEKCVVFNPGVSINTFFLQMIEDTIKKSPRTEKTITYKILGDIISTAAFVWQTKMFSIKSSDPLKLHEMNNFIIHKNKIDKPITKDTL
jgi:hypothetical protein